MSCSVLQDSMGHALSHMNQSAPSTSCQPRRGMTCTNRLVQPSPLPTVAVVCMHVDSIITNRGQLQYPHHTLCVFAWHVILVTVYLLWLLIQSPCKLSVHCTGTYNLTVRLCHIQWSHRCKQVCRCLSLFCSLLCHAVYLPRGSLANACVNHNESCMVADN